MNKGLLSARVNLGKTTEQGTSSQDSHDFSESLGMQRHYKLFPMNRRQEPQKPQRQALLSPFDHDEAKAQRRERTLLPLLHVNPNRDKRLWPIYTVHLPTCPPGFKIVTGTSTSQASNAKA